MSEGELKKRIREVLLLCPAYNTLIENILDEAKQEFPIYGDWMRNLEKPPENMAEVNEAYREYASLIGGNITKWFGAAEK